MSQRHTTKKIRLINSFAFIFLIVASSCASQHKSKKTTTHANQTNLVEAKLGKNTSNEMNENNTLVLYRQKAEQGDFAGRQYKYVVIRKLDSQVVLEGTYKFGYVKWLTNTQLEVLDMPSAIEQDETKFKKIHPVSLSTNIP